MQLIWIGKLSRLHGFRGAVVVHTETGKQSALSHIERVWVGVEENKCAAFAVEKASWMPKGWKVKLQGWDSEEMAKAYIGQQVYAAREDLPDLENGEYYHGDLVGCAVVHATDETVLGTLESVEVVDHGVDLWWVKSDTERFAIPSHEDFVIKLDLANKKIYVDNLEKILKPS